MDRYLKDKGFLAGNLPLILSALQDQVGRPTTQRPPMSLRRTEGNGDQGDVGDLVDYMVYDGDPNMGLLKGLFGGRAQPGTNAPQFYDQLGRRRRGK